MLLLFVLAALVAAPATQAGGPPTRSFKIEILPL